MIKKISELFSEKNFEWKYFPKIIPKKDPHSKYISEYFRNEISLNKNFGNVSQFYWGVFGKTSENGYDEIQCLCFCLFYKNI